MKTIAMIEWPGDEQHVTKVWKRQGDGALVYWTGPEEDFTAVEAEFEADLDEGNRVGINLVDLRHNLMDQFDEYMADTDRNLLAEIDAMVETVRAAG